MNANGITNAESTELWIIGGTVALFLAAYALAAWRVFRNMEAKHDDGNDND